MRQLELVLRASGEPELVDLTSGATVWTADGDNDFWEFIGTDICEESDLDEILGYLEDTDKLSAAELDEFENGGFDIIIEEDDETDTPDPDTYDDVIDVKPEFGGD